MELRRPPRAVLGAAFLLAFALAAARGRPAAADDFTLPFQVSDRGTGVRLAGEFEAKSASGDWAGAADRLQQLLDFPADEPVVIRAKGFRPVRFEGSAVVARRLFDALPPAGRAAWEKNSRARAEDLLARGLRLRREADLRDAARRYPARDVRRRAHDALAQLALVRADLTAAQFQLLALHEASEPGDRPAVLARLAWSFAQAADAEGFESVRELAGPHFGAPVASDRGAEPLGDFLDRMARLARSGASAAVAARQFGGDAHGSGLGEPPPAPEAPVWRIRTEFQDGSENDDEYSQFNPRERMRTSPVVPLVARGLVFVNNGLSLCVANLASGTPAWRFDSPQQSAEWRDSLVASHTAAVADGSVYAALAVRSDAKPDRYFYNKTILYPLPHRCLFAFDERTGETLWSHETSRLAGREDAAEIDRECVSSPPLVVGEDLIVAAWTYEGIYDVRLVCYERRTGRTRWRTSLVQGQQELNLFGRPVKELSTGPLAEWGGRVYFATGLGVAAAVEREDGRIAWLAAYPQKEIARALRWYETRDREVQWWPSPVSATAAGVVMAPVDSTDLLCFDPRDGVTRWQRPRVDPPNSYRWFLGVTGGRAYVLGTRAMAFEVAGRGEAAWTAPDAGRIAPPGFPASEAAGRGLLTKEHVYAPTDRAIVAISTMTGAVDGTWPLVPQVRNVAPVTGNLVAGDGALLFVSRAHIDASFSLDDLHRRLEARLAQDPEDPGVGLEAGESFAAAGRLDEAIDALGRGFARLPQLAPRVRDRIENSLRRALYETRVARSRLRSEVKDHAGAADDLAAAADVARDKGDAVRALFALAAELDAAGRGALAEEALRRISAEFAEVVVTTEGGDRAQAGALALFRLADAALSAGDPAEAVTRWLELLERRGQEDLGASDVATAVRERLARLAETEPALVAAAVRSRAKRAFETARDAGDAAGLDRAARLYDDPEFAAESALAAADLHTAGGRPRDAALVLAYLLGREPPPRVAARALWKQAAAYRALGETVRERASLRRLAAELPDQLVDGSTEAADAVQRELAAPRFRNVAAALPGPRPPLSLLWQRGGTDQIPPQVLKVAGAGPSDLVDRVALVRARVLELADEASGRTVWEQPLRIDVRAAAAATGLIVVAGSDSLSRDRAVVVAAFSAADGREAWPPVRLAGQFRAAETTLGVMYLLYDASAAAGRPNCSIAAVSLATGEVLAKRSLGADMVRQITPAEDAIVLTEPTRGRDATRRAIVTIDGTTLSLRGRLEMTDASSPFCLHPPSAPVVVTGDGGQLAAVNVAGGGAAWRVALGGGRAVKAVFAVPGGVIVSDDGDALRKLDAETGRELWRTPLDALGNLIFEGEAAEGDVVVATLKPRGGPNALAVALDAATGKERWRRTLPLAIDDAYPHPEVLAGVVAYASNERLGGGWRSRVILLDRTTGALVQEIEHPTIGRSYQHVLHGPDWIALSSANELAVYGTRLSGR